MVFSAAIRGSTVSKSYAVSDHGSWHYSCAAQSRLCHAALGVLGLRTHLSGNWSVGLVLRAGGFGGPRSGRHVPDQLLQRAEVERLGHSGDANVLDERGGLGCEGVSGAEDQSGDELGSLPAQMGDEIAAAHARHADVRHDDVEVVLF